LDGFVQHLHSSVMGLLFCGNETTVSYFTRVLLLAASVRVPESQEFGLFDSSTPCSTQFKIFRAWKVYLIILSTLFLSQVTGQVLSDAWLLVLWRLTLACHSLVTSVNELRYQRCVIITNVSARERVQTTTILHHPTRTKRTLLCRIHTLCFSLPKSFSVCLLLVLVKLL